MSLSYCPDYSRAEKSYKAASIQRDHLTSGITLALPKLDRLRRMIDEGRVTLWEVEELLRGATDDLKSALDYSEAVR